MCGAVRDVRYGPKADIAGNEPAEAPLLGALRLLSSTQTDRLNCEHNLAGRSGLKDLLVRTRGCSEWQYLANNEPQSAVFETCNEPGVDVCLFGRCDGPERECANRARRDISSRGLIVTSPRLPITMTRPLVANSFVSEDRFTLASISRMMSTPRLPVACRISS